MKNKKKNTYQLSKINKSLKKVKNPVIRERLLMLKTYYQGNSLRDSGDYHGCSHRKIAYWKDRYESKGLLGLETKPKPGLPPKLDQKKSLEIRREILKKISKEGWETKQIREYIKQRSGVIYSLRHIVRIAQKWGFSQIKPRPQYLYAKKGEKRIFLK